MATKQRRIACTWLLPAGIRSAVDAEASRRGSTGSRVVEEVLLKYLPAHISRSIGADLRRGRGDPP